MIFSQTRIEVSQFQMRSAEYLGKFCSKRLGEAKVSFHVSKFWKFHEKN